MAEATENMEYNPAEIRRKKRQERILRNANNRLAKITYNWSDSNFPEDDKLKQAIEDACAGDFQTHIGDAKNQDPLETELKPDIVENNPVSLKGSVNENMRLDEPDSFEPLMNMLPNNYFKPPREHVPSILKSDVDLCLVCLMLGVLSGLLSCFWDEYSNPVVFFLTLGGVFFTDFSKY